MNDLLDFARIREISNDYFLQRMTKEEYRKIRKEILDKIDREMNSIVLESENSESDRRFINKLVSYFKNPDEEKIV